MAFAHLPAIVYRKANTSPLYGTDKGTSPVTSFDHTVYISGQWVLPNMYPRNLKSPPDPIPPTGNTPVSLSGDLNCHPETHICRHSVVYYLPIMGNAQWALSTRLIGADGLPTGDYIPVRPPYGPPPLDSATAAQFDKLLRAIGFGIGAIAAHETGHQLNLPLMDCGPETLIGTCPEDRLYQDAASGSNHEWFYERLPGQPIHWTQGAICKIEMYLLGSTAGDKNCH